MNLDCFQWGSRTLVVGVLNLSPDSFSGDGVSDVDLAVRQAQQMVTDGADIIDVGGESTRPGFEPISAGLELRRVAPVLERLVPALPDTPISVDTTKLEVARVAFELGVTILNDTFGLRGAHALADLCAQHDAWVVAMHNQRGHEPVDDPVAAIRRGWRTSLELAQGAGIDERKVIVDPGFGFGWDQQENNQILRRLSELCDVGRPMLVGTSRKRMTGQRLGWSVHERLPGSAATATLAIASGADLVRVHDVAGMTKLIQITDAIVRQ